MGKYKSWKCGICGDTVIEGQRFLVVKDIGFTHLEYMLEKLFEKNKNIDRNLLALIDLTSSPP